MTSLRASTASSPPVGVPLAWAMNTVTRNTRTTSSTSPISTGDTCTPENDHRLLFQMMHGTFGTLGVLTMSIHGRSSDFLDSTGEVAMPVRLAPTSAGGARARVPDPASSLPGAKSVSRRGPAPWPTAVNAAQSLQAALAYALP
jgi:hypothetical protein